MIFIVPNNKCIQPLIMSTAMAPAAAMFIKAAAEADDAAAAAVLRLCFCFSTPGKRMFGTGDSVNKISS